MPEAPDGEVSVKAVAWQHFGYDRVAAETGQYKTA